MFELEPAYILHARDYCETSKLLDLFTRNHGRFTAVARGAKCPRARLYGVLQPFVLVWVSCYGRGELRSLRTLDTQGPFYGLKGSSLVNGLYLNELLVRLLPRWEAHPGLFELYQDTLRRLSIGTGCHQAVLRLFEKSLLKILGYELQLTTEVETGCAVEAHRTYWFYPLRGPVCVSEPSTAQAHKMAVPLRGHSLLALATEQLEGVGAEILLDIKRLMRYTLAVHLEGRPLLSRQLVV